MLPTELKDCRYYVVWKLKHNEDVMEWLRVQPCVRERQLESTEAASLCCCIQTHFHSPFMDPVVQWQEGLEGPGFESQLDPRFFRGFL